MSHIQKKTLKKLLGEAGAGFDSSLGIDRLYDVFLALVKGAGARVIEGLTGGAPSTPSAQAAGVGNTTWNVNISAGRVVVGGVVAAPVAQADFSIHAGSLLLTNGQSVIAALVQKNVSGTITTVAVKGSPATTGSQVAPTQAQISAAIGADVPWTKLFEATLNRTGDTTVTQSQDNTKIDFGAEVTVE